jgi:hypothetical protein
MSAVGKQPRVTGDNQSVSVRGESRNKGILDAKILDWMKEGREDRSEMLI